MPKSNKLIKGRGENPNSHGNHKKLNPAIRKEVWLTPEEWEIVKKFSDKDNYSAGVRRLVKLAISAGAEDVDILFAKLPHIGRAKHALQMLIDKHPEALEYAEGVLIELEDLEIEHLYEEAKADGVIEPKGGAYIV